MTRAWRALLLALILPAAASGCASPGPDPARADYRLAEGFASRRPADVAVLPVSGALPGTAAGALRASLREGLLGRRFAPLRDREVDADPKAFRPGGPTAVLALTVDRWDDAALYGAGIVRFSGTLRLHAAGSPDVLYEARLVDVKVDAGYLSKTMEDRALSVTRAAADAADRLLAKLPVKGDG